MTILIVFLLILVGLILLIKYLERSSIFYPGKLITLTPKQVGIPYEDVYLTTIDGIKINAWFVKGEPSSSTVIFAHGNAGTMSQRVARVRFWHELGLNILMFDYRGYGQSQGEPTEKGVYLDAQAAYDYLLTRAEIDPARILAHGASLGGAVVIDLAIHRKLAALIVESSFSSAKDMAKRYYPFIPSFVLGVRFDSISKIKKVHVPKLFLHSPQDEVVPLSMGQKLYQAAPFAKSWLSIYGGHNEGLSTEDVKIKEEFKHFLQRCSL